MFRTAILVLVLFTLLTGFIYPVVVTEIGQVLFPWQANGSLIKNNNKIIGSALIGQSFTDPNYFWGRPSATTPFPYNGASSSGSNLGPLNTGFLISVKNRMSILKKYNSSNNTLFIPVDLVTASGSGLDPDISPAAAFYQAARIANRRNIPLADIYVLIQQHIQQPTFGILGEPRVNVLLLNMALDTLSNKE